MFQRGFKVVNEEKERIEEEQSKRGGLFRFFLKDDKEEADITFLTEQPINFYEHTLKSKVNGKDRYESIPCTGEDCPHCADGDRPSLKSAWLIIDHREVTYKKDGKEQTISDQLRLLVYGTKIASQLDRKSERYGLTDRLYTIVRLGKGTATSYTFEHGDKYTLTREEIESVMPDSIKQDYDGTMDSLYTIIENQISMSAGVKPDSKKIKEKEIDESLGAPEEKEEKPTSRLLNRRKLGKKEPVEDLVKKPSIKELMKQKRGIK